MLKTVSSVANALGALNYKGTWDAAANTPTLASGVGTQGDYYVVSVAGTTDLDGITNWGVGDWAAFNGSVWQRVEGGADGNFVNLTVTGTSELDGNVAIGAGVTPTYPLTIEKDSDSWIAKIENTGSDADAQALLVRSGATAAHNAVIIGGYADGAYKMLLRSSGNLELLAGNLVIGTSGKGIDFSATAHLPGMTSELLDDYEEGTWTANLTMSSGSVGYGSQLGKYVKVGNQVTANAWIAINSVSSPAGALSVALPFAIPSTATRPASYVMNFNLTGVTGQTQGWVNPSTANLLLTQNDNGAGSSLDGANLQVGSELYISITYIV
jgi:hypothetical protein